MAIAVAQTAFNAANYNNGSSGTTVAVTLTVSAGSTLVVWVTWDDTNTATCSVADPTNGTYTAGSVNNDTGDSQAFQRFFKQNVAAGSTTITATFGAGVDFRGIAVAEVTGAVTTGGSDGSSGNIQASPPGTSADAITTASMTNAAQPALIVACSMNVTGSTVPAAGTGFTSNGSDATLLFRVESKRLTTTSSTQAATFTDATGGGANHYITAGFIFDEAAGGGTTVSLTGQGAASAGGTLSPVVVKPVTGQAATSAGGTAAPLAAKTLTGGASSSAAGSVAPSATVALSGQAGASAGGTVSPSTSGTVTLTGQAMTAAGGTLAAQTARALAGQASTSAAGSLAPAVVAAATGAATGAAQGVPAAQLARPLGGLGGASAGGTVSPQSSGTVALVGLAANATAGAMAPGTRSILTGNVAVSGGGTLTPIQNASTDTFALAPCPPTMAVGLTFTLAKPFAPKTPTRAQ